MLCRDANHPFEDGLDIPVYLRTGDDDQLRDISPINLDNTEKVFILLLVDDKMYCSDVWHNYIGHIVKLQQEHAEQVLIMCVEF